MLNISYIKHGISILKNDDDTCDAIQETLVSAYKNLKSLREPQYFSSWIIKILINKCYDILRKNKKIKCLNEKMQIEEDAYYEMYCNDSGLENVLKQLEDNLKTVVVLYYYDDLPVAEIANILNIPEGTVKSRLSRARDKIYTILKKEEGEYCG